MRVVATDKDNVLERNDYQPFGKRWNTTSMPVADNRDRFNGKENQSTVGKIVIILRVIAPAEQTCWQVKKITGDFQAIDRIMASWVIFPLASYAYSGPVVLLFISMIYGIILKFIILNIFAERTDTHSIVLNSIRTK